MKSKLDTLASSIGGIFIQFLDARLKTSYPILPLCAWSIAEKALVEIASALYVGSKGRTRLKSVIRNKGSNLLNGIVVFLTQKPYKITI